MDNHLGALWCWLRELDPSDEFVLVHLDEHHDAAPLGEQTDAELRALDGLTLDEFTAIRATDAAKSMGAPMVRWDTYLDPLARLRPGLKRAAMVVWGQHQRLSHSSVAGDRRFEQWEPLSFLQQGRLAFERTGNERVLQNIDVDFFFSDVGDESASFGMPDMSWLSEHAREHLLQIISAELEPEDVITIALSPETSGGWPQAESMGAAIISGLGRKWPGLPPDP